VSFVHQRPDQRPIPTTPGTVPGSRSGAAETAATLQQSGIPPLVPGLKTASSLRQGPGVATVFTFPAAGRIWGAVLSGTFTTNTGYAGQNNVLFQVVTASGVVLSILELAAVTALEYPNGNGTPLVFGLNVGAGEVVKLDVNGGVAIADSTQRASAILYYSVP